MTDYRFELPEREIKRYLGYGRLSENMESPEVARRIERCKNELINSVTPRAIWKYVPLGGGASSVVIDSIEIHSDSLWRNLRGCMRVCVLAITLGPAPDRLIQRASVTEVGSIFFYQAIGAAMAEEYADHINGVIREEAAADGYYTRPRFSPGYGDFAIEHQRDISDMLNMAKEIGITLTDSFLMVPTKSVTAVIGLSREDIRCPIAGCEICERSSDCAFRRAD